MRFETFHRTIATSASVSSIFQITGAKSMGLVASTLTSCQIFFQVSWDETSANFVRAGKKDGSGDFVWSVGVGSNAITLQDVLHPFPYGRIETSVAQAQVSSLSLIVKL